MGPPEMKPSIYLILAASVLCGNHGTASTQQQLEKLVATDGDSGDGFGFSVAISGDLAVIGAWGDGALTASGSAYVLDIGTGEEMHKLVASDALAWDEFGYSVGIGGGRAVVGARWQDDAGIDAGAAYVFDLSTGQELLKLAPPGLGANDQFGWSVAVSGEIVVATSMLHDANGTDSGAAWVFDATTGDQRFQLLSSDGEPGDWFGYSVAVSGARAIVGAPNADTTWTDSGAAYVFDVTTGQELFKLVSTDILPTDHFGLSVAICGNLALVGAPDHVPHGAAYLFDVTTGQQLFKLTPPLTAGPYAKSVALSGKRALVRPGHVYDVETGGLLYSLAPSDGPTGGGQGFGTSVACSGARVLIGAYLDDDLGQNSGAAYLFAVPQSEGNAYCFGDGSGTPCPCFNPGNSGEGCANSTGSGTTLWAAGPTGIDADELVFYSEQLVPSQPALLFAARNALNQGNGLPFADGLRCAGGGAVRLGAVVAAPNGLAIWGPGLAQRGDFAPGELRRFQGWYRDPLTPCGSGSNLSNGLEIAFTP